MATNPWVKSSRSPIHGRGLYARRAIPAGTRIIEYTGEKITKAESVRRAEAWDAKARRRGGGLVYIFELNKRYDLDGNIAGNIAKYINHSCEPNCESEVIRGRIWIVTIRDIAAGEELYYDYGYDLEHFMDHPCLCGTDSCVGFIVREDQRKKLKSILRRNPKAAALAEQNREKGRAIRRAALEHRLSANA
ncbi:MAG: SET domain-containing protein [Opitutales bacterium]